MGVAVCLPQSEQTNEKSTCPRFPCREGWPCDADEGPEIGQQVGHRSKRTDLAGSTVDLLCSSLPLLRLQTQRPDPLQLFCEREKEGNTVRVTKRELEEAHATSYYSDYNTYDKGTWQFT